MRVAVRSLNSSFNVTMIDLSKKWLLDIIVKSGIPYCSKDITRYHGFSVMVLFKLQITTNYMFSYRNCN